MTSTKLLNALFWALIAGAGLVACLMGFTQIGDASTEAPAAIALAALACLVNTFIPAEAPAEAAEAAS